MKRLLIVLVLAVVAAFVYIRVNELDVLLWQSWTLNRQPLPERALDLGRYRVDIEAAPIPQLEDDLSALTYNHESDTLFGVLNGRPLLVEISLEGELLRQVTVHGVDDMEGLAHISGDRFVLAEERAHRLILADIPRDATEINVEGMRSLTIGLDQDGNVGFEGLTWDHIKGELLVVKERDPLRLLRVQGFVDALESGSVSITEIKRSDSDQLFMADLSALSLDENSGHLLLLSDESHMAVEYDQDSQAVSVLGLWRGMSGLGATVPQAEGIAIDAQKRIYIVSEPNLFYRFVRED
ncbi:SdiA-regulated domain-containing protein [Pseudomonas sp. OIL-1]|uniref:SdiA-regulated domain-containing protein n=1 Tax=Pseudomonas sp. OIL-1 TaxID=2706126 RepID=UPI0013A78575|nr:SdiA-regulated domain-containing protein [Pseudomonas sp. OIL-1]QIB49798.1 hypothetical protein G3M63_01225 [Pseudomonas sp. OIL-1]